jgi:hypothetical protein
MIIACYIEKDCNIIALVRVFLFSFETKIREFGLPAVEGAQKSTVKTNRIVLVLFFLSFTKPVGWKT